MLSKIRLELARTANHPNGDPNHGYEFVAPLDAEGHIDAEAWRSSREECVVRRFAPGEDDENGRLVHTQGRRWMFHYEIDDEPDEDEPGYRFDAHVFREGEYVSITEHDGEIRPFRVISVG